MFHTRGAIFTYKDGIVLRPQYYVFEMYANLLKDHVLDVWKEDVPVTGGSEKTVDLIDAVVTYGDGALAGAAVNKDHENAQTIELRPIDSNITETDLYILNSPSPDSYNDIGKMDVKVTAVGWQPLNGKIVLPPHSVCVAQLK